MTINYSALLGLAQPTTNTEAGTWGDAVNNGLTSYVEAAIAGALSLTSDADVTLTITNGTSVSSNLGSTSSQYAVLNCTGARTAIRSINVPNSNKSYVIVNGTTGGFAVRVRGVTGPTTGVTVPAGKNALVTWTGSDFAIVATTDATILSGVPASGVTIVDSGNLYVATNVEGALQEVATNLSAEATTRAAADLSEANTRASADASLQTQINTITSRAKGAIQLGTPQGLPVSNGIISKGASLSTGSTSGVYDIGTGKLTANAAGMWAFSFEVTTGIGAAGNQISWYVRYHNTLANTDTSLNYRYWDLVTPYGTYPGQTMYIMVNMAAGDYIQLIASTSSNAYTQMSYGTFQYLGA